MIVHKKINGWWVQCRVRIIKKYTDFAMVCSLIKDNTYYFYRWWRLRCASAQGGVPQPHTAQGGCHNPTQHKVGCHVHSTHRTRWSATAPHSTRRSATVPHSTKWEVSPTQHKVWCHIPTQHKMGCHSPHTAQSRLPQSLHSVRGEVPQPHTAHHRVP